MTYEEKMLLESKIRNLKQQLKKYKEDVEQVELFGMERADYEEKKTQCVAIIEELRVLEAQRQAWRDEINEVKKEAS